MSNILGVVLCSGESEPPGIDKGLLSIIDSIWAKYIGDKLSVVDIPVVFSVNKTQRDDYSEYIDEEKLVVDSIAIQEPLRGLLSVHKEYPSSDLLLLACDMIDMDETTIKAILQIYVQKNDYDFYVYQYKGEVQPFCGIYTAKGLKNILLKANNPSTKKLNMQQILKEGNTKRLTITNAEAFKNYNEPI